MGSPTMDQFDSLLARVNAIDGQNLPNPKNAVDADLYARIAGLKTMISQTTLVLQGQLTTIQTTLNQLNVAVNALSGVVNS